MDFFCDILLLLQAPSGSEREVIMLGRNDKQF